MSLRLQPSGKASIVAREQARGQRRVQRRREPLLLARQASGDWKNWRPFAENSPRSLREILDEIENERVTGDDGVIKAKPVGYSVVPFDWITFKKEWRAVWAKIHQIDIAACLVEERVVCSTEQQVLYALLAEMLSGRDPYHVVILVSEDSEFDPCGEIGAHYCTRVKDCSALKQALDFALDFRHLRNKPVRVHAAIAAMDLDTRYGKLPVGL